MNQTLFYNARLVLEGGVESGAALVRDGRIAQVFTGNGAPSGLSASESFDLRGAFLAPGMVDIHIHGSAGVDVLDADSRGLAKLSGFLLAEGVTGYFATLVPTDERGYESALKTICAYVERQDEENQGSTARRARVLGIHFEGPFVSDQRCGALKREHFRTYDGDPRSVAMFAPAREGRPRGARLMTLAPEIPGGIDLVRELDRNGVRVFIGHSQADPETLDRAMEAGARHITHFPNALDPLHHRKPGAVAWGLVSDDVSVDCIADFQHAHPLMLRLIYKSKAARRMALISDAISATGLGDGEFSVWGEHVAVRGGRTSLARGPGEGTIAGSVITMRQALKNMILLGVPVSDAVRMASLTPAEASGVGHEHGSIKEGKRADLIAFDDDLNVWLAVVGGAVALDKR